MRGTPTIIIVTGPPGAGKTTLARRLAADLALPLITKDDIKESLYDSLGTGDVEWSQGLGRASIHLLYLFLDRLISVGRSAIVESNFYRDLSAPHFLNLSARHPFHPVQVVVTTDVETVLRRYRDRIGTVERHPGHHDSSREGDLPKMIEKGVHGAMPLDGPVIEVNTTDFESFDYESLLQLVLHHIEPEQERPL